MPRTDNGQSRRAVAYVVMAYPRLSETYITSALHRVERAGGDAPLSAIKPVEPWERGPRQPVVDLVNAQPHVMPETTSLTEESVREWLPRNIGLFGPGRRP